MYNRWLAHHGVKDQKWGVKNGPPYPLDRSISDGHKLIKSDGSPQSKKKYKTSEKTAHKRAERKARTNRELERARKLYGKDDISEAEINALRRAKRDIESHHVIDPEIRELITMDQMDHAGVENYSVWDEIFEGTNIYSVIEQYKDTPVSVIDIWKNDRGGADVSIAVRNDDNYRHKGYASRALENGVKYFYDHPELEYLIWGVNSQNRPSIELAKKYGFYLYDKRDDGWETYTLDQKKEVKHTMYNRWSDSNHLEHHGVKGQVHGIRNGPPYPLSRQERFRTIGPDGRPITSKVAYKKAMKNVRAANRSERKANPNGTPQDKEERNSFGAQIKRKYREHKRKQKELEAARDEYEQKTEKDWKEATDRLKSLNLPEEVANRLEESSYIRTHGIQGQSWGPRPGSKTQGERLNEAIDKYLSDQKAARDAAKEHGTAEEVMKYRDTFNKDEWNEIAARLEAEAKVKKLLERPLDSASNNQNQSKSQNQGQPQEKSSGSGLTGKLKKIAEKGDAREVYQNRSKFTPEQLQTISRRLQAEETIAKYADNQLLFKSDALRNLENIARYAQTAGNIATGVSNVVKAFSGNNNNNNNNNNGGQQNNQQQGGGNKKKRNKNKNKGNGNQ